MHYSHNLEEAPMELKLDQNVLKRVREVLDHNHGADGVYEFSLRSNYNTPRVVVASDKADLLPINSVEYEGKTFYIGFPRE